MFLQFLHFFITTFVYFMKFLGKFVDFVKLKIRKNLEKKSEKKKFR